MTSATRKGRNGPRQPVLIGDAEREQVAAALGEHFAAGRLPTSEFETRLDVVYAARTREELGDVLVDLPAVEPPRLRTPAAKDSPVPRAAWTPWALTAAMPAGVGRDLPRPRPSGRLLADLGDRSLGRRPPGPSGTTAA